MKALIAFLSTALLTSALTAQAAPTPNTPIFALPCTISAPGTYVLTRNLTYTPNGIDVLGGINIFTPITGSVIVDLKGFTITGPGVNVSGTVGLGIIIGDPSTQVPNASRVIIRNGTITNFASGIQDYRTSDITITNVVFNQNRLGVALDAVSNSTINKCQFNGFSIQGDLFATGIADQFSPGGNSYNNNTFTNMYLTLEIDGLIGTDNPVVLERCQFGPPPSN